MTLEHVSRFRVSRSILGRTETELRAAGKNGYELFAELSDVVPGHTLRFYRKELRS